MNLLATVAFFIDHRLFRSVAVTTTVTTEGVQPTDDDDLANDVSSFLQTTPQRTTISKGSVVIHDDASSSFIEMVKPVTFLHIEKTGSSWINVVISLPGLCSLDVPAIDEDRAEDRAVTATLDEWCRGEDGELLIQTPQLGEWDYRNPLGRWDPNLGAPVWAVLERSMHPSTMGDRSIYKDFYAGRTIAMFRQPEQRIISGFYHPYHSWWKREPPKDMLEYAKFIQGCQTKMLTRTSKCPCCDEIVPSSHETSLAVTRVKDAFFFAGITDQWDLSVCLFHKMVGGRCRAREFADIHPGPNHSTEPYDTAELHGWTDQYDRAVYDEALLEFESRLQNFNVSYESCRVCFQQAAAERQAST